MYYNSNRIAGSVLEKLQVAASSGNMTEVQEMLRRLERPVTEPNQYYDQLFQQFESLEGTGISRQEASLKYGIPVQTVKDWQDRGAIRVIERAKRRGMPTTINERDIAALAGVIKEFRVGRGGPIPGFRTPVKQLAS